MRIRVVIHGLPQWIPHGGCEVGVFLRRQLQSGDVRVDESTDHHFIVILQRGLDSRVSQGHIVDLVVDVVHLGRGRRIGSLCALGGDAKAPARAVHEVELCGAVGGIGVEAAMDQTAEVAAVTTPVVHLLELESVVPICLVVFEVLRPCILEFVGVQCERHDHIH